MQLTPDQKQLFEQLARRPEFIEWLTQEEAKRIQVLKVNTSIEQLCQAQGAVHLLDSIKAHCGLK